MRSEDVAYLAGLFDGEGSVYMQMPKGRSNLNLALRIVMCDRAPLQWVVDTFGVGTIYDRPVRADRPKASVSYEWKMGKRAEIRKLCDLMHPYLIVKRWQVEVMLSYISGLTPGEQAALRCKNLKRHHV